MKEYFAPLLSSLLCVVSASEPMPKPQAIEEQFYRSWLVIESLESGKSTKDPEKLNGNKYDKTGRWSWGRRGELTAGSGDLAPRINVKTEPMRLDFPSILPGKPGREEQTIILPCIFKFDGGNLVVVYGKKWIKERELKDKEDYEGRPTEFKSTKENGLSIDIMSPCSFYDQD